MNNTMKLVERLRLGGIRLVSETSDEANLRRNKTMREAADTIESLQARVKCLEEALGDVINPLGYLRREAEREGNKLSGMAYVIANDPALTKQIARDALRTTLANQGGEK